jgi:IS1 family transposase
MVRPVPVETVNEDDEESEVRSDATEAWESQWEDFGNLPSHITEFNVALAEFIIKQTGTKLIFPEVLCQEGRIHSYERFIIVLKRPYSKIIELLGGKVSTEHENGIILARFLSLREFTILGTDNVPAYSNFKNDVRHTKEPDQRVQARAKHSTHLRKEL